MTIVDIFQTTGYCEIFSAKIAFIFIAKAYFVCSALFHPSLRHTPRWRCSVHKFCSLVGEVIASNPLVIQTREPKYIDRLHMIFFQFLPCRLLFRFYASPEIRLDLITWMPWQDCCHLADTSLILICNPISHKKKWLYLQTDKQASSSRIPGVLQHRFFPDINKWR